MTVEKPLSYLLINKKLAEKTGSINDSFILILFLSNRMGYAPAFIYIKSGLKAQLNLAQWQRLGYINRTPNQRPEGAIQFAHIILNE